MNSHEPVADRLRQYREKLLDLTKRNRLLNFRATRASTVRVVDEIPGEVHALLFRERKGLSFLARPREDVEEAGRTGSTIGSAPEPGEPETSTLQTAESETDADESGADESGADESGEATTEPQDELTEEPLASSELPAQNDDPQNDDPQNDDPQNDDSQNDDARDRDARDRDARHRDAPGPVEDADGEAPRPAAPARVVNREQATETLAPASRTREDVDEPSTPTNDEETRDGEPAANEVEPELASAYDATRPFPRDLHAYDPEHLADRHRDRHLQTDLDAARLDHNLLRIHQLSRAALEEQGYNTLFLTAGSIEWRDPAEPTRAFLAPLFLLPVELRRRSPRSAFHLHAGEDDPILNPSLAMKVERELGVALPAPPEDLEDWSLRDALVEVSSLIESQPGWRVVNDISLGLFSFTKFTMYKDLETFETLFARSPLVRRLCGALDEAAPVAESDVNRTTETSSGAGISDAAESDAASSDAATSHAAVPSGEPAEERAKTFPERGKLEAGASERLLDRTLDPESTFQVLDADSSQQEAILAVREGGDIVLEGPPGTGKSQTIANLIAECLGAGQRVLFVSEKMAALEVVYNRLRGVGLADFCLELHSRHASKRGVVEELARTLALSDEETRPPRTESLEKLKTVRDRLNTYIDELTSPIAPIDLRPYEALSRCVTLRDTPEVVATLPPVREWNRARLDESIDALEQLHGAWRAARQRFPDPASHPWYGSELESLSYQDSVRIRESLDALTAAAQALGEAATRVAEPLEADVPSSIDEIEDLVHVLELLARTPRASEASLRDAGWSGDASEPRQLIRLVRDAGEKSARLTSRWKESLLEEDLDALLRRWRVKPGFFSFLSPTVRRDRRVFAAHLGDATRPDHATLVADLEMARDLKKLRARLEDADSRGRELFASAWDATSPDPDRLERHADWVLEFRKILPERPTDRRLELATSGLPDPADALRRRDAALEGVASTREAYRRLAEIACLDETRTLGGALGSRALTDLDARARVLRDEVESLHDRGREVVARRRVEALGLAPFVERFESLAVDADAIVPAFERLFYNTWLDAASEERPALRRFSREEHTRTIEDFRELDYAQLFLARERLRERLLGRIPDAGWEASERSELGILQREVRRKRGHKPIRKLFELIPGALSKLKPCFLMSPLSVAQFLDPRALEFDVVIFDEASQIAPEDAVGAIARGKQLVVVGDSRQLPPTTFFQGDGLLEPTGDDDDTSPDLESILDECVVAGFDRRMLRWHYRSRDESLIAFSNRHFYENRLNTFPGASTSSSMGVSLRYLPDAIYDRGGTQTNVREAEAVARAVFEHFRTSPEKSLGVGAFSQAQQLEILDRIEALRREDESLESLFDDGRDEHFFVKNLENIQGDERDVIFLSVGYGPDAQGRIHYNFGPLNKPGGERRLNVLVTRARQQLQVFSSLRASDIDPTRVSTRGSRLLRDYLEYAESSSNAAIADSLGAPTNEDDSLARAVAGVLRDQGFDVARNVGRSKLRLDLGVRHASDDGSGYALGIECDGSSWYANGTARDRDRLRQQVLEGLGWRLYRIWSTEWLRNPKAETERLVETVARAIAGKLPPEVLPILERVGNRRPPRRKTAAARPRERGESLADAVPYSLVDLPVVGEPDDFASDPDALRETLARVIEHESPIHRDEAARRVAGAWRVTRLLRSVSEAVSQAGAELADAGRVIVRDEFFWRADEAPISVRQRDEEGAPREPDLIAIEELAEAAAVILARELRISRDDLVARVAKLIGFSRTGSRLRERIDLGLARLLELGRASQDENGQVASVEEPA